MDVNLVMFRGDGERRRFKLLHDVTLVGRREDCDLRIPLSEVSRKHCRLIKEAGTLRLEDLGSSNGTFHNGQRIQESIVSPGDSVQIGPVLFVIQINGKPAEDQLQPVVSLGEEEEAEQSSEAGGLAPAAENEVGGQADDDSMETLTSDRSQYDLVIDDEPAPAKGAASIHLDETQPGRGKQT